MAKRNSLTAPELPEPISERKASTLCRERAELDERRLELNRQADALRKQIEGIDAQLALFVDARKSGQARTVELSRWRLSIIQATRSPYWLRELTNRIGEKAIEELRKAAGTFDKLTVEPIDKPASRSRGKSATD